MVFWIMLFFLHLISLLKEARNALRAIERRQQAELEALHNIARFAGQSSNALTYIVNRIEFWDQYRRRDAA